MNPYYPVESCPACGNVRPWRHGCPCGDPGGMPRTLPTSYPRWSKAERHLYAGQACRVMGETDHAGNMLVCFLTGPLGEANECRWMTDAELFGMATDSVDASESAEPAPHGDEAPTRDASGVETADGEINGCQVEGRETAA
jgi:hypothetical protein